MSKRSNDLWAILPREVISLLIDLEARGFRLSEKAGKLVVVPASKLSEQTRGIIREHRDGILAAVLLCSDEVVKRALEMLDEPDRPRCDLCDQPGQRCQVCSLAHIVAYQVPTTVEDILRYHLR